MPPKMPPSMPPADPTPEHVRAVLLRGCLRELRYPRLCAARFCRRHRTCRDLADRPPQCLAALDPVEFKRLTELHELAIDILTGRMPPRPSDDPVQRDHEEEALCTLFRCFDDLPGFQKQLLAWLDRYQRPPQPPEDAQKLLADIKRDMARNAAMDAARGF